jgi:hypothetical protein
MKTDWKSNFHPLEARILALLDIMVMFTIFLRFCKVSSFGSNHKGLAFGFNEKCMFAVKTSQKSVFYPHKAHIPS